MSELSLIWKVMDLVYYFYPPFKAAAIIAYWRRKEKIKEKQKKTQINKSKEPGTQDILAGAGSLESEPWNCSATDSADSYHLFMEKNVNNSQS